MCRHIVVHTKEVQVLVVVVSNNLVLFQSISEVYLSEPCHTHTRNI